MKLINGFDGAIVGTASVHGEYGQTHRAIYSGHGIVNILMASSGMSYDEAIEYISFNISDSFWESDAPIVMWPASKQQILEEMGDAEQ